MRGVSNMMMVMIWMLVVFAPDNASGQYPLQLKGGRHKIGFMTGGGFRKIEKVLDLSKNINETNYYYKVTFFQLEYHYSVATGKLWELELVGQPQVNLTSFHQVDGASNLSRSYELAFTTGLMVRRQLGTDVSVYSYLCSGPQYVPCMPERQSNGFIFSDNFYIGSSIRMSKNIFLDLRPGFRHISNAGLKPPNAGVNDMTFVGGVFVKL